VSSSVGAKCSSYECQSRNTSNSDLHDRHIPLLRSLSRQRTFTINISLLRSFGTRSAGRPIGTSAAMVSLRLSIKLSIIVILFSISVAGQKPRAIDVAAVDRERILKAANQYLREKPITITAVTSPRSAGGLHDYFSEGDYWWPDPKNPGGPYIQRDGMSNPDNFN